MKKRFLGLFVVLACFIFASCGSNTGSVTLKIDEDVIVSDIVITKYSGSQMKEYSEKEITLKQGEEYTRTMAKGKYGYYIKAEGGPTYTKDKGRMFKIDYQYNELTFEILPGEETIIYFSKATPNVMLARAK